MIVEYGLYIHLPYCRSLCPYCAFAKAPLHRAEPARLLGALRAEWEAARSTDHSWSQPRTVYLGGGTPTALDPATLRGLVGWIADEFELGRLREWTAEANPEGLSEETLAILRRAGVNRLSLGVQSLEPAVLRVLGRIHTPKRALEAIARVRAAGFANLSVDLMIAVPSETTDGFMGAARTFVDLGVPHLSVYSLQIEEGTPFAAKVSRGALVPPGEDVAGERYEQLAQILTRAGYRHYEVSSWALPGYEARHNQGYWTRRPYLGLGPGAHSFDGLERWRNEHDVNRYYERIEAGVLPRVERELLTVRAAAEEGIFLGLRRARGIHRSRLERLAGEATADWSHWAERAGAVKLDPPGRIRPTDRGLLLAHELSSELFARIAELPRAVGGSPARASSARSLDTGSARW